jgi:nickel superoxide dismutase
MKMSRNVLVSVSLLGLAILAAAGVLMTHQEGADAHCQVPCGIYDDAARIKQMRENAATISKAIHNIRELAGEHDANAFNQAARWVAAKEDHASHIIKTVSEYFLTQKVKPAEPGSDDYEAYLKKLADHHRVMVAAMKTKQSAVSGTVTTLIEAIDKLATHY